ncbi:MAG: hypothetical protein AAGG01_21635, partial [Planctomycetota bacterium]
MSEIPTAIQRTLVKGPSKLAWVTLRGGHLVDHGGDVAHHGLKGLRRGQPLPADEAWSSALLALVDGAEPIELRALQLEGAASLLTDVIAWCEGGVVHVVFLDA